MLQSALKMSGSKVSTPLYDRKRTKTGIVHLGPGAFHRAHQAVYTDEAMAKAGGDWGICGVSMRRPDFRDRLNGQDYLYTLSILDEEISYRVVGSIKEALVAFEAPKMVLGKLADPDVKIVTLTVTEKGYCLNADGALDLSNPDIVHDLETPSAPHSAIGYVVEALRIRKEKGASDFAIITCDNLADNGIKLKKAVLAFAGECDKYLSHWIEDNIAFPCTMVDSITPATDDALRARVLRETGIDDQWPIQREAFAQWVIEDFEGPRPAWDEVGAQFTNDVSAFEAAKLRLLNAPHSALAYLGSLAGYDNVSGVIREVAFEEFIRSMTDVEIMPGLTNPQTPNGDVDLSAYRDEIIKRFKNPEINHLLSQIAWDGSQKLPQRVLLAVQENLSVGRPIDRLCLTLAGWRRFCEQKARSGEEIVDSLASEIADRFSCGNDPEAAVRAICSFEKVVPANIASNDDFKKSLLKAERSLGDGEKSSVIAAINFIAGS